MLRGRYEGLLYKLADEGLDSSCRARRGTCLPDRPGRGSGGGQRSGPGSRADCITRDLIARYFGRPCARTETRPLP